MNWADLWWDPLLFILLICSSPRSPPPSRIWVVPFSSKFLLSPSKYCLLKHYWFCEYTCHTKILELQYSALIQWFLGPLLNKVQDTKGSRTRNTNVGAQVKIDVPAQKEGGELALGLPLCSAQAVNSLNGVSSHIAKGRLSY